MIKIVGFLGGGLLLGAAVAAAIVLGLVPLPFGPAAEASTSSSVVGSWRRAPPMW